ncbi:PTS sugar transporter subunit IIB [Candidatus Palauibacter sp.]|uniref:PTS sugar transporter subunit IIB n=1 Tax=Candidatus Palauibacter sp. TaxID=3101350 RepID=UPI003B0256F2
MPFELFRIDERLIHGQVIVGWGNRLGLQFYVVVDEVLAASDWEQEIWASALGREATAEFLPALETARRFAELEARPGRGALLTRDTATMRALAEYGCLDGRAVNVGGLHDGPGRRKILDYLHLSHDEFEDLKAIGRHGVVSARDVPTARAVPLRDLEPR